MSQEISIPSWIRAELFEKVIQTNVKNFKKIQNFRVCPALAPGENYATVMLKVHIDCLLHGGRVEMLTLMLKVPHDSELYRTELIKFDMFETESGMYHHIVPEFEELYRAKGLTIRFGAKSYELAVKEEYILLEDLSRQGFRNVKRQNCLDMEHCKGVLKKMAQFHAASAVWIQKNGAFPQLYQKGMIRKEGTGLLGPLLTSGMEHVIKATKRLKNGQEFYSQLQTFSKHLMDKVISQNQSDEQDFRVLNHGDCWANNIMFQYNGKGQLQETYFVDLQLPCYGTPSQDLLYFLVSSSKLDLKIKRFDELIRYYHEHLINYLKLLEYSKPLPYLRDIHQLLIKDSIWGKRVKI